MRKLAYFIIPVLVVAGALEFLLYRSLTKFSSPIKKEELNDPRDILLSSNDISFRSEDGANLNGWLIQGRPGYPAVVIAHNYGSNRSIILVKLEGLITSLNKQGYFIFLFDFRGHGKSGSNSTLGFRESEDVAAAVRTVLQYKQIARRIAVLGVGMGAIASAQAFHSTDEVKCLFLDSVYENISSKHTEDIITEWPFLGFTRVVLDQGLALNMRVVFRLSSSDLRLDEEMPKLYPKAVIFIDKVPLTESVKSLYDTAKEPKELLQLEATAADELIAEERERYNSQVEEKIKQYLPPVRNESTLELSK